MSSLISIAINIATIIFLVVVQIKNRKRAKLQKQFDEAETLEEKRAIYYKMYHCYPKI